MLEVLKNFYWKEFVCTLAVAVLQKFETSLVVLILQVFSWILLKKQMIAMHFWTIVGLENNHEND